jgi:hypothetical protein
LSFWDQGFANLDFTVCTDAVPTLTSRWSGTLIFADGDSRDARLRTDTLAIDMSGECLSKALGVDVDQLNLGAVCSSVATESTACTAPNGVCRCSARRVSQPAASGAYGVIGTRVVVGSIFRGSAWRGSADAGKPRHPRNGVASSASAWVEQAGARPRRPGVPGAFNHEGRRP